MLRKLHDELMRTRPGRETSGRLEETLTLHQLGVRGRLLTRLCDFTRRSHTYQHLSRMLIRLIELLPPLDKIELLAIVARAYEPLPRVWEANMWLCPQCKQFNLKAAKQCRCRISRDGLPGFCER